MYLDATAVSTTAAVTAAAAAALPLLAFFIDEPDKDECDDAMVIVTAMIGALIVAIVG